MKNILVAALIASTVFYNVGCTSDEVSASVMGVGLVIGIAGGGFGGGTVDNRDQNRDHGYDQRGDHGGNYDRGGDHGGGGYDRGGRRYNAVESEVSDSLQANVADMRAASSFAQRHNISEEASAKIQAAFSNVSTNGLASFQAIGLDDKALKSILSLSVPAKESINAMAVSLQMSPEKSAELLQSLVGEFQAEASNSQSSYWQSCQAKGKWKTPQNAYCSSMSWNGCSPETGASLCY